MRVAILDRCYIADREQVKCLSERCKVDVAPRFES